jgi:hypothetical protein
MGRPKKIVSSGEETASMKDAVSAEIKSKFSLEKFKERKLLNGDVKFKDQKWIAFSKALQDALGIPGVAMGHINLARGRSNTGKTTSLIEVAVEAQKAQILPVIIITEMKHDWNHWKKMGFQMNEILDNEGKVVDYDGFFIYRDITKVQSIEEVAALIMDLLSEQAKGNLPYDLLFVWDSSGSVPCQMCIEQGRNNPMWNAGAMATQFGNFVNQKIIMSRKEGQPYTNTLFAINKTGIMPPGSPFEKPKMTNKGGDTLFSDASIVLTFGNITNAGTSKIKATKDKKEVEFALRTKVACDKNHVNGITTKNTIISTVHGFIDDSPGAIDKYKKAHSSEWADTLGKGEYKVIEDNSEWTEKNDVSDVVDNEE